MINKVLKFINESVWQDNTDSDYLEFASFEAFKEITRNKNKNKMLYRIAGQAGSGKTSQISYALSKALMSKNIEPVCVSVRFFAKYHKDYSELLKIYGEKEIREKTNGFALKCLTLTLEKIFKSGYMILLDLTLLDPIFEQYVYLLTQKYGYDVEYHIISANKAISDKFILNRQNNLLEMEGGRIIYSASKKYFYNILPKSLKYLSKIDKSNICYVWNVVSEEPIAEGKLCEIIDAFKQNRKIKNFCLKDAEYLKFKKYKFFINHLK